MSRQSSFAADETQEPATLIEVSITLCRSRSSGKEIKFPVTSGKRRQLVNVDGDGDGDGETIQRALLEPSRTLTLASGLVTMENGMENGL